jgi:putative DNA primase/helicase
MMTPNSPLDYLAALQSIPVDGLGDDWVRVSAAAKVACVSYTDWHDWTSVSAGYKGEADARARWNSFKVDGGAGAGTLIHIAKAHGWKPVNASTAPVRPVRVPTPPPTPKPPALHQKEGSPPLVQSAAGIWARCVPATWAHEYVKAKGLHGAIDGLKVVPKGDKLRIQRESMAGALVVPVYRVDGSISSLQFIAVGDTAKLLNDAGTPTKLNLPKHKIEGWFTVGQMANSAPIYVCEGIGQAVACWRATGLPSVVTFGIGRTHDVVAALLAQYPHATPVLVPDRGQEEVAHKVAIKFGLAVAKMPEGEANNFDANDLAQRDGDDVLEGLLEGAQPATSIEPPEEAESGDDAVDAPFASEIDLAEQFAAQCDGRYRWTPGIDWMANTGTHWVRDDHLSRYTVAKSLCRTAASGLDKQGFAAKVCSSNTTNAVLSLARSEPNIMTRIEQWDSPATVMLLNTQTGVYDLTTGKTVSRDGLLFTQITDIAPAAMQTPVWDKFISEVFAGDVEIIEFIQRMGGYCLTGSTREQKLFFLYGEGSNGKSVFLEVLRAIGGKYSHNLPSEALMTSKHERHPTTFAALQGKRLAISSEIEQTAHWAESKIKSLTGDATMTARYMRGDEFTFDITHKHILAGNSKPRLKGDDFAMVRRMVLIPFTQKFEGLQRDDYLHEKLKAEYAGILHWFIEGARKWASDGLRIPSIIKESTAEYMAQQNDIQLWIEECCTVGGGLSVGSTVAYQSYAAFKSRNGEHAESGKAFSARLEKLYPKAKTMAGMVFKGLALDPSAQQSNDYERGSRGF